MNTNQIKIITADITKLDVDSIVNAAKGGLTTASKLAYQLPKM